MKFLRYILVAVPLVAQERGIEAIYRLANQSTGTYRELTGQNADGSIRTVIDSDLIFNRMNSKLEMKSTTEYLEGSSGLKSIASEASSSDQTTRVMAIVGAGTLQISTSAGGKTYDRSVSFTGDLTGPDAARHLIASRLHKAGDTLSYQTFAPELGTVVTIAATVVGPEDVTVDQRRVPGLKLEETMTSMPGKITVWLDQEGWMLRQLMASPLGEIETIRSEAHADVSGAKLPDEIFGSSIIQANVRLPRERLTESIKLKITHRRPELGWPEELDTQNQKVVEKTRDYVILNVTRVKPGSGSAGENPGPAYLKPNALLQSDDAKVQEIARSVAGEERDPWIVAQALQKWTNDNMHFDMGIAVAPASEVARERRGTCFGYSMLLGSLVRAAGIPSRLRMGYVYAGGIWGGHAWVDVSIGNRWIPLDGALYTPGAADAARFSIYTSALEEGTLAQIGSMARLFGNADVSILEYTVAGKTVVVPANAKPSSIDGDVYRNPWIGFSITKPAGFKFSGFDLTWPQTTLVALDGPDNRRVEVENLSVSLPTSTLNAEKILSDDGITGVKTTKNFAGHNAVVVCSDDSAGAVIEDRGAVWLVKAKGHDAGRLLEQVASSIVLDK